MSTPKPGMHSAVQLYTVRACVRNLRLQLLRIDMDRVHLPIHLSSRLVFVIVMKRALAMGRARLRANPRGEVPATNDGAFPLCCPDAVLILQARGNCVHGALQISIC